MKAAALVLCGGRSRRMGADKALLDWGGQPLYRHVAGRLAEFFDPVWLAPGTPGRLGATGYPEVADDPEEVGPLGGICAALAGVPERVLAVVAADMPRCDPTLLVKLADRLSGYHAVIPETTEGLQPLHAIYSGAALPILRQEVTAGHLSVIAACRRLDVRVVGSSELSEMGAATDFATNLNVPADLYDSARRMSRLAGNHRDRGDIGDSG